MFKIYKKKKIKNIRKKVNKNMQLYIVTIMINKVIFFFLLWSRNNLPLYDILMKHERKQISL